MMILRCFSVLIPATILLLPVNRPTRAEESVSPLETALTRAGGNRGQLEQALARVDAQQREGMEFLITNMPDQDLQTLDVAFLVEHVEYAYRAWNAARWKSDVPPEIFLNNVLPYTCIDERRDSWRKDFYERFQPLVQDIESPERAAAILNQKIFAMLDVRYSTQRPKANQSPYESTEAKLASCTGLSVILIDACRSVGIPARFVGTPLWSDQSGNHSWVEVWGNGWHFTGAAEPAGDELDKAWFVGRAAKAQRDDPRHAIYATSFKKSPLHFPLVWNRRNRDVYAVNVTDRYTRQAQTLPEGSVEVMFRVLDKPGGERRAADIRIGDAMGDPVFEGTTKDERFDANDHVTAVLPLSGKYNVSIRYNQLSLSASIEVKESGQLFTFRLSDAPREGQ